MLANRHCIVWRVCLYDV